MKGEWAVGRRQPGGVAQKLLDLPRPAKRLLMTAVDASVVAIALWGALALKFDRLQLPLRHAAVLLTVAVVSTVGCLSLLGLYRTIVRFMAPKAMLIIVAGTSLSVSVLTAFDREMNGGTVPISGFVIFWAFALLCLTGSRFFVRYLVSLPPVGKGAARVAIYGSGDAGARLSAVLLGGADFEPVAFVDDKKALHGSQINGIRVHPSEDLPRLVGEKRIDRILLAMPSASRRRRREILSQLEPLGIHVQSLPDLSDIIAGQARIDEIREVDVSDLLGRDAVPPEPRLFESCIRGKCVMVTGAGGSIGSELCRQILRVAPRQLVLFEMSELALYNIERELKQLADSESLDISIVPLLGNAHYRHRVREVLATYGVQTIYHAAAYKHVPIVEHNIIEGIHNNVISTWYTAEAALEAEVETFVLISTDKAVNPANVMGATKRLAELVLQGLQERTTTTRFCMVRFGNVLASSGSVVPLFQEQIRCGGPVTVTHPDVIRYFMTIPEAAQLVIQAGSMAKGGDVFVLDMGRPVRIDDLARRMIGLAGLSVRDATNPEGDIEILYTGLRAAEKLFEELLIGSNITGTQHPMIMRAIEHSIPWTRMQRLLDELLATLACFDCRRALALLCESVAEYRPAPDIRDYVWTQKSDATTAAPIALDSKVTPLAAKRRQADVLAAKSPSTFAEPGA